MRTKDIARVCHEANRAIQVIQGDPAPSSHWDDAPIWQRDSAVEGVAKASQGQGPEQLHESWCEFKRADGWVFGPVKDAENKLHPCVVAYDQLPEEQKIKDDVFAAIVEALA